MKQLLCSRSLKDGGLETVMTSRSSANIQKEIAMYFFVKISTLVHPFKVLYKQYAYCNFPRDWVPPKNGDIRIVDETSYTKTASLHYRRPRHRV